MITVVRAPPVVLADIPLDTFVANRPYLDIDIYVMWLDGNQVEEICKHPSLSDQLDDSSSSKQIVFSYVADQVRSFHILEKWLYSPVELADQPVFQLTEACRTLLLEKYYSLDRGFVREVLGRKFNHRPRKAFEDESHRTGTKLNSCYRQHENMRRVFKSVGAMPGTTIENIQSAFLLPDNLARVSNCSDYACVLFMSAYRFELSTRKLLEYSFEDFVYCASEIMKGWTYRAQPVSQKSPAQAVPAASDGVSDLRIDKDYFYSLKELKFLLERETAENLKRAMVRDLPSSLAAQSHQDVFRDSARLMILIALNVHHSKQFRLLFVDITEKLCGPWKSAAWTMEMASRYLDVFYTAAQELNEFKSRDPRLAGMWRRFFSVFNYCVLRLYREAHVNLDAAATKTVVKFETGKD